MAAISTTQQKHEDEQIEKIPISNATKVAIKDFLDKISGKLAGGGNRGDFFYTNFVAVNDLRCTLSECSAERDLLPGLFKSAARARCNDVHEGELAWDVFKNSIDKLQMACEDGYYTRMDKRLAAILEYMDHYNEVVLVDEDHKVVEGTTNGDVYQIKKKIKDAKCVYESEMVTLLVNHVLKPLAPDCACYLDDQTAHKLTECFCGCGTSVNYTNTSIGCNKVFHGRIDAIVGTVPIVARNVIGDEDEEETNDAEPPRKKFYPDHRSSIGIAQEYSDNKAGVSAMSQATATCIVFSFYRQYNSDGQQVKKPQRGLCPTILLSKKRFSVFLYDSVNDILLRTQPILLQTDGILEEYALFYLWCVLSCDFICPDERALKFRSGFHEKSSGIHYYREHLKLDAHCQSHKEQTDGSNMIMLSKVPSYLEPAKFTCPVST
ncbi:uncharacterized protein LOC135498187 [Lineus longissimus]|uniref:uncharacterized protein LOC135498187 n=1 Tax=Lineus longissimus TaxID=88925 RepID=UPI002B4C27B2